jgi:hypothetical protein
MCNAVAQDKHYVLLHLYFAKFVHSGCFLKLIVIVDFPPPRPPTPPPTNGYMFDFVYFYILYILKSNPHHFYSFRELINQMQIRFAVESWNLEKR